MRMTLQMLLVLSAMLEDPTGRHYGFDLARQANVNSSVLYPILKRLETAEWATSAWEEQAPEDAGRPRRRYYTLTKEGAEFARVEVDARLATLSGKGDTPGKRRGIPRVARGQI